MPIPPKRLPRKRIQKQSMFGEHELTASSNTNRNKIIQKRYAAGKITIKKIR
ncbi:MAG: hypothetical protein WCF78_01270 [archaeon]